MLCPLSSPLQVPLSLTLEELYNGCVKRRKARACLG